MQNILHIPLHGAAAFQILAVKLLQGGGQILPELLAEEAALLEILRKIGPQLVLILPVSQQALRIGFIVGIGESIRQVVGQ